MKLPLLAVLLLAPCARAAAPKTPQEVLSRLHSINVARMELGNLAQSKSENPRIRRYGALLVADHLVGDKKVMDLAAGRNVRVGTMRAGSEEMEMWRALERASGPEFDRRFLEAMPKVHQLAADVLETVRAETLDEGISELADRLLPIVDQHRVVSLHLKG